MGLKFSQLRSNNPAAALDGTEIVALVQGGVSRGALVEQIKDYIGGSGSSGEFDTMPTVDGDPIVESGSNSDGEWTRWADGTQMCRYISPDELTTSTGAGSIFLNNTSSNLSFPMPFTSVPELVPASRHVVGVTWGSKFSTSSSSTGIRILGSGSNAVGRPEYIAIGRYK